MTSYRLRDCCDPSPRNAELGEAIRKLDAQGWTVETIMDMLCEAHREIFQVLMREHEASTVAGEGEDRPKIQFQVSAAMPPDTIGVVQDGKLIAALTAERDALREQVKLWMGKSFPSPEDYRIHDNQVRAAKIEALEWATRARCKEPGSERWRSMIEAEIARLKGEDASGGQG